MNSRHSKSFQNVSGWFRSLGAFQSCKSSKKSKNFRKNRRLHFFSAEKWFDGNRLKRILVKFRGDWSWSRGVNGRFKFGRRRAKRGPSEARSVRIRIRTLCFFVFGGWRDGLGDGGWIGGPGTCTAVQLSTYIRTYVRTPNFKRPFTPRNQLQFPLNFTKIHFKRFPTNYFSAEKK